MEAAIWDYRQEFLNHQERRINGSCGLHAFEDFDTWLRTVNNLVSKQTSREGVHASTFLSIRKTDQRVVGSIQLRHSLTPELEQHGGHIGYAIRPTERGKGYGSAQLREVSARSHACTSSKMTRVFSRMMVSPLKWDRRGKR